MPHLLLEYSDNIPQLPSLPAFFADLHQALAQTEAVPIEDLKSRAICHRDYWVGTGEDSGAFVALTLKLLDGRDISVRQRLLQAARGVVGRHFASAQASGRCQVSVEVLEMERSTYSKQWPEEPAAKGSL